MSTARVRFEYRGPGGMGGHPLTGFLLLWAVDTLSLWVASTLFPGSIAFTDVASLFASGLLLGLANGFIKPIMFVLTLPITVLTLGLFVLVLNGLTLLLVAWLVPGLLISSFLAAIGLALFVSIFGFVINRLIGR